MRSSGRANRFSQGLRQASFSFAKRGSLSTNAETIDEAQSKPVDASNTTETLINRLHNRGHLSRGLSNCRQESTVTNASQSSGKGDGETASLCPSPSSWPT